MTEWNGFGSGTPTISWQNDNGAYTLGSKFRVTSAGWSATKVRLWVPSGSPSATTSGYYVAIYAVGNTTPLASAGPFTLAGLDQWVEQSVTPVALTSGADYIAAALFPGGYYGANAGFFASDYDPSGPLLFPSGTNGVFNSGSTLTYPASNFGAPWYGVDVAVNDSVGGQTVNLGLAAETDAALAVAVSRALRLGLASETDAGLALGHSRIIRLGLAAELDAALALTLTRRAHSSHVYVVQSGSLVECTVKTTDLL